MFAPMFMKKLFKIIINNDMTWFKKEATFRINLAQRVIVYRVRFRLSALNRPFSFQSKSGKQKDEKSPRL
jgi:hypothetical protein